MSAAPLRLVFDPVGEELAAARACEAEVFLDTYGNTAEDFAVEYGPYEASTGFLTILEDSGEAVATCRLIASGPAGLKSLNDVSRPPWEIDGPRSARSAGIDIDRTWDVATIAVRPGKGRGGLCASALYHGIFRAAHVNGIDYFVMIMESDVRQLLNSVGIMTQALPGAAAGEYLGSASSVPLWGSLRHGAESQRQDHPDAYRLIYQGVGLDGITLPTDWTWRNRDVSAAT